MTPDLSLIAIINILGALQCALTALALFTIKAGNRVANRLLGLSLLALAVLILDFVMYDTRLFLSVPHLYPILDPVVLAVTPAFFLYVRTLTEPDFVCTRRTWLHFVPFVVLLLLLLPEALRGSEAKLQSYLEELATTELTPEAMVITGLINVQVLAYFLASLVSLNRAVARQADAGQPLPVSIRWLRGMVLALIAVSLLSAVFDYLPLARETGVNNYVTPLLLTVIVYGMGYLGIRQSQIFGPDALFGSKGKYRKSVLNDEMATDVLQRLETLMADERPFLDGAISLPGLAQRLRVSTHLLSQVLNERLGRSFHSYIGELRVQETMARLAEPESDRYTLAEVAYAVGFNSLSAFNAAFKRHAGMSPSEYRKRHRPA